MIKAINSTNFKSVIVPKYPKLSESQEKVLEDIRIKLGDKAEKKHFLITPLKDDVVELSEVYNVREVGTGIGKKIRYSDPLLIGRYNEETPFEMNDYKKVHKEQLKDLLGLLGFVTIFMAGLLGFMFAITNKKPFQSQETEKVVNMTKDSLQNVKQDSLNFAKESLKVLK